MGLPHQFIQSLGFIFQSPEELQAALGEGVSLAEKQEVDRLISMGLPPVTSVDVLSVMFGFNPGFVWYLINRNRKQYQFFTVPKGKGVRRIYAPKVALKLIQRWLGFHFARCSPPSECAFGFVPERSHLLAAQMHLGARWVLSYDIEDFFPSVEWPRVKVSLEALGYLSSDSFDVLERLCCLDGRLPQGAPTSPPLSNLVLMELDRKLLEYAQGNSLIYTRYADDLVISGKQGLPVNLLNAVREIIESDGWRIAERKIELAELPRRLKVHGLLVDGERIRLTKGYRNRLRAYRHIVSKYDKDDIQNFDSIRGHLSYLQSVDRVNSNHQE